MRQFIFLCLCLPILIACGRGGMATSREMLADIVPQGGGVNETTFSFSHVLNVVMEPSAIKPRFERAKDKCLHDTVLHCRLLEASFNSWKDQNGDISASARLTVALPHGKLSAFETMLLSPVSGEKAGEAVVSRRSVSAENVGAEASDASKKLTQLTDYRDRLTTLSKRPSLSVDDLIKIESELSKTQGQLDDLTSQKRDIDERIGEERMTVLLDKPSDTGSMFRPSVMVWHNAMTLFGESTANALQFLIQVIPWLPLITGAIFLIPWLWRVARRRSAVALSAPTKSDMGDRHGA